jgi:hypothetical protein
MRFLRQSTATAVVVGPFLDKSDALTPKTALADQSSNGRLVKVGTGAAFVAASWAHDGLGGYAVGLTTAHTDTVGRLRLAFSDPTTFCPVWEDFSVLPGVMYDWFFGTAAPPTAAAIAAAVQTGSAPAWYAAPVDVSADVTAIRTQTDRLLFDGADNVLASAQLVIDKAGYSLTQPFPTNFAALAIDVDGNVTTLGGGGGSGTTAQEVAAAVLTSVVEVAATSQPAITVRGMLAGIGACVGVGIKVQADTDTPIARSASGVDRVTQHVAADQTGNSTAPPTLNLPS